MVFDLIVEAAHEDRHETAAADVATHQDLTLQEVQLQPRRDQRHADVVRRERRAQIEAEDGQLDGEEGGALPGGNTRNTRATRPPRRTVNMESSTHRRSTGRGSGRGGTLLSAVRGLRA